MVDQLIQCKTKKLSVNWAPGNFTIKTRERNDIFKDILEHGSHSDWKNGKSIFQPEESQGFLPIILENQKNYSGKLEKNTGKVREISQKYCKYGTIL